MSDDLVRMRELLARMREAEDLIAAVGGTADTAIPSEVTPTTLAQAVAHMQAARVLAERVIEAERQALAAQQELKEMHALTAAILEASIHAILVVDLQQVIRGWNAAAERIYGWPAEDAVGRTVADLIVPERYRERHTAGFRRFAERRETSGMLHHVFRAPALHRDGREFEVEILIVPLEVQGLFQCLCFSRGTAIPWDEASPHIDEIARAHG